MDPLLELLHQYGETMKLAGKLEVQLELHVLRAAEVKSEVGVAVLQQRDVIQRAVTKEASVSASPRRSHHRLPGPSLRSIIREVLRAEGTKTKEALHPLVVARRPNTTMQAMLSALYAMQQDGKVEQQLDGWKLRNGAEHGRHDPVIG